VRKSELKPIGGSNSDDWNKLLANQVTNSLWTKHSSEEKKKRQLDGTISGLIGIGARDELEGMIAAQLIAAHNAAMECYRRAMLPEQTFEGRREALSNKLSRTSATLVEALNRHRGKGQQKVTVEHVHVHSGGQAVVGVVESPGGQGEASSKEQPPAKQLTHEPQQALRSADEERQALPSAGNEEREVSDARRPVSGRAKG
jgi:hypothetical protein